mmetsp:Transcript_84625/g.149866  ORF Transcript_84625/g.149866 Transcript_84625/m.149866 type:complete len:624 (+) Transcript_84625:119-1990(+)
MAVAAGYGQAAGWKGQGKGGYGGSGSGKGDTAAVASLSQAGVTVDSVVGGEGAAVDGEKKPANLTSVCFWGICDIKYDPRLPEADRVKVLEFGDGRSSRFSHHGRAIKVKFENGYCMDPTPIKRAVMVENKKFTHDMFVQAGFAHLRPHTTTYHRRYAPDLADRILTDLRGSQPDGAVNAVVLKLCNRSRGAGIVVVTAAELDRVLKMLLIPPTGGGFNSWLASKLPGALNPTFGDNLQEQCLHWWSNECPVFVVERCCQSIPVRKDPESDLLYDGTMRVAFALYRKPLNKGLEERKIAPLEIDWLGGYWKLPRNPVVEAGKESLEEMHGRIVSSFNSVEKRTAPVPEEHLQEIFAALTPALPRIFSTDQLGVQKIMGGYKNDALFRAFALSRVAAAMRVTDMNKAKGLFDLARNMVPQAKTFTYNEQDLPERAVSSYITRNVAVCSMMAENWSEASKKLNQSLTELPTNSTSYYLFGHCRHQEERFRECVDSMMRSIALDPDFKSPYIALGNAYLKLNQMDNVLEASVACLRRHPDAPGAQFNIGQAIYHKAMSGSVTIADEEMLKKGRDALELAKKRVPEQWRADDDKMLEFFQASTSRRSEIKKEASAPVHTWKVYGWRP